MINAEQAVQIAVELKDEQPAGVWQTDKGFVVGFNGSDPYANLTVFVDRETGEADTLSAQDYAKIMPELRPV